jgi:hypothetical protein
MFLHGVTIHSWMDVLWIANSNQQDLFQGLLRGNFGAVVIV